MTRNEFIKSIGAAVVVSAFGKTFGATLPDYDKIQSEIDEVTPKMYFATSRADRPTRPLDLGGGPQGQG